MAEPAALSTGQYWTDQNRRLTPYAYRFLTDLWERTGGFNDDVSQAQAIGLFDSRSAAEIGQFRAQAEGLAEYVLMTHADVAGLHQQIESLNKLVQGLYMMLPEREQLGELSRLDAVSDAYTPTNVSTDRSLDADDAAGAISASPSQAEVENIRDAVLALADNVGTLMTDLQSKGIIG